MSSFFFFNVYPGKVGNASVEVTPFKSINPSLCFGVVEDIQHAFCTDNQWVVHAECAMCSMSVCLPEVNCAEKIRVKIRFRGDDDNISSQVIAFVPSSTSIHTVMERAYQLFYESPAPSSFVAVLYDIHSKNQVESRCGIAVDVLKVICCVTFSALCHFRVRPRRTNLIYILFMFVSRLFKLLSLSFCCISTTRKQICVTQINCHLCYKVFWIHVPW